MEYFDEIPVQLRPWNSVRLSTYNFCFLYHIFLLTTSCGWYHPCFYLCTVYKTFNYFLFTCIIYIYLHHCVTNEVHKQNERSTFLSQVRETYIPKKSQYNLGHETYFISSVLEKHFIQLEPRNLFYQFVANKSNSSSLGHGTYFIRKGSWNLLQLCLGNLFYLVGTMNIFYLLRAWRTICSLSYKFYFTQYGPCHLFGTWILLYLVWTIKPIKCYTHFIQSDPCNLLYTIWVMRPTLSSMEHGNYFM